MVKHEGRARRRPAATLPTSALAQLRRHRSLPGAAATSRLDALLVITEPQQAALWSRLPEPARWRGLHARSKPAALKWHSTSLGNAGQTLAVLGYLKPGA